MIEFDEKNVEIVSESNATDDTENRRQDHGSDGERDGEYGS